MFNPHTLCEFPKREPIVRERATIKRVKHAFRHDRHLLNRPAIKRGIFDDCFAQAFQVKSTKSNPLFRCFSYFVCRKVRFHGRHLTPSNRCFKLFRHGLRNRCLLNALQPLFSFLDTHFNHSPIVLRRSRLAQSLPFFPHLCEVCANVRTHFADPTVACAICQGLR